MNVLDPDQVAKVLGRLDGPGRVSAAVAAVVRSGADPVDEPLLAALVGEGPSGFLLVWDAVDSDALHERNPALAMACHARRCLLETQGEAPSDDPARSGAEFDAALVALRHAAERLGLSLGALWARLSDADTGARRTAPSPWIWCSDRMPEGDPVGPTVLLAWDGHPDVWGFGYAYNGGITVLGSVGVPRWELPDPPTWWMPIPATPPAGPRT